MPADAGGLLRQVESNQTERIVWPDMSEYVVHFTKEVEKWLPPPIGWIYETVAKPLAEVTFGDMVSKISPKDLAKTFEMRPDEIVAKVGLDAGEVAAAFCDRWIGYLSDATGYPLDFTIDLKGEPFWPATGTSPRFSIHCRTRKLKPSYMNQMSMSAGPSPASR